MPDFLLHLIDGAVGSTFLLSLAIMLCAFIFEDATIFITGVLAADKILSVPVAISSLFIGIVVGDAVLYSIGALARMHPKLAHYIDHEFTAPFRAWLEHRYAFTIFSGHFVPGLRLTTYIASGFFRSRISTFILMAVVGNLLWETVLFSASYWFGALSSEWVAQARWSVAFLFLGILFFIGRYNLLAYRAKKKELEICKRN